MTEPVLRPATSADPATTPKGRNRVLPGWSLHPAIQVLMYGTWALLITFAVLSTRGPGPSDPSFMWSCLFLVLVLVTRTMRHDHHQAELTELPNDKSLGHSD